MPRRRTGSGDGKAQFGLAGNEKVTPKETVVNCSNVASYESCSRRIPTRPRDWRGAQAPEDLRMLTNYVDQVAKTRAVLGGRADAPPARKTVTQQHPQASNHG